MADLLAETPAGNRDTDNCHDYYYYYYYYYRCHNVFLIGSPHHMLKLWLTLEGKSSPSLHRIPNAIVVTEHQGYLVYSEYSTGLLGQPAFEATNKAMPLAAIVMVVKDQSAFQ